MTRAAAAMAARGAEGARGAKGERGAKGATPGSRKAPLPRFEERDLPSWHDEKFQGKLDDLKVLGDEIVALQRKRAELDDAIKERNVLSRAILEDIKDDESWSVRDDSWTCSYTRPGDRETLVRELLIQAGVTLKQLEKGTKKTPVTPYVTFRERKERE